MRKLHPLFLPELQPLLVTPEDFSNLQSSCASLALAWEKAVLGEGEQSKVGSSFQFLHDNGLLYRKCISSKPPEKVGQPSLVVHKDCRPVILSVAPECPLAGHFSHRKTEQKIMEHFYWPGRGADIRFVCISCDKWQRMFAKGRVPPVLLKPFPIITEPFSRVVIDLVGPLSPPTSEAHRYILSLVDFATWFPKAVPLKETYTISVAEALVVVFSRRYSHREKLSNS